MLNLIPWREQKFKQDKMKIFILISFIMLVVCFVLIAKRIALTNKLHLMLCENQVLQKQLTNKQALLKTLIQQQKENSFYLELEALARKQIFITTLLNKLEQIFPENCALNKFSVDNRKLLLEGELLGSNQKVIRELIKTINSQLKVSIKLDAMQPVDMEKINFKLSLGV